ncbi:MAG: FAD:protein FMN transferase [Rhizobiales bacterium]|nr:FAD:protein FMN transferase [Hyphomicrobiales bacterium]
MVVECPNVPGGNAPTRRRFLTVAAGLMACGPVQAAPHQVQQQTVWRGVALGAEVQIGLVHPDEDLARDTLQGCVQEIKRLEAIFSLYDPHSTLSKLNRTGRVEGPEFELVDLISLALQFTRETRGAFDLTVQRLWNAYAEHFSTPGIASKGPANAVVRSNLNLVGSRHIRLSPQDITLERDGMALTLNGIAQGYITDRIRDLLKVRGFNDVLIDLGEIFAGGERPDGRAWQVGISDGASHGGMLKRLRLKDRALATSSDAGFAFSPDGRFTHLIDPRNGECPRHFRSVSVVADDATTADALSTSFAMLRLEEIEHILEQRPKISASVVLHDGTIIDLPKGRGVDGP